MFSGCIKRKRKKSLIAKTQEIEQELKLTFCMFVKIICNYFQNNYPYLRTRLGFPV